MSFYRYYVEYAGDATSLVADDADDGGGATDGEDGDFAEESGACLPIGGGASGHLRKSFVDELAGANRVAGGSLPTGPFEV